MGARGIIACDVCGHYFLSGKRSAERLRPNDFRQVVGALNVRRGRCFQRHRERCRRRRDRHRDGQRQPGMPPRLYAGDHGGRERNQRDGPGALHGRRFHPGLLADACPRWNRPVYGGLPGQQRLARKFVVGIDLATGCHIGIGHDRGDDRQLDGERLLHDQRGFPTRWTTPAAPRAAAIRPRLWRRSRTCR